MGKNAWGSKALSSGYSHGGPVAGAPVVVTGGPRKGDDPKGGGNLRKANPEIGVKTAAGRSAPGGMKTYKAGAGVKV